jgi:hypothetical protein
LWGEGRDSRQIARASACSCSRASPTRAALAIPCSP